MQIKDIIRAVAAVAERISLEVRESRKASDESINELDRLLLDCYEAKIFSDAVFRLELDNLRKWYADDYWPENVWYHGLSSGLLWRNWDRLILKCDVKELLDPDRKGMHHYSEETAIFAQKLSQWLSEYEIKYIASALTGRDGSIFRFLNGQRFGVTFQQLQDEELTQSDDFGSIKTMLNRLSGKLKKNYGYRIKVSQTNNRIKLERLP